MKTNLSHPSSPRAIHPRIGTRGSLCIWNRFSILLLGLGLCLSSTVHAAVIPGLFNTGVDNANMPLANTSPDPHYTLLSGSPIIATPIVATSSIGFPIPPWLADNASSAWIAPTINTYGPGATDGSAIYRYQIQFDLTGLDPATAVISGQWSTDNYGVDILLNGLSAGQTNTSQYGAWTPFYITKGFVAGTNTLTFLVENGYQELVPNGPTGLRVEMTGAASFTLPIVGLFNTGVDAAGTPQADDARELHYTLVKPSAVGGIPSVATSSGGFPIGPWLADNSVSAWIAPSSTTEGPNATNGAANYYYQTRFDLSGRDPRTAAIEGQWSSDNGGIDILINGVSTGQSNPSQYTSWTPFRIAQGFVPGLNTLTFVVNNGAGETTASAPTGLRVEMRGNASSSCIDFQSFPVMSLPNPWVYQGIRFFARNFDGSPWPYPGIRNDGAFTGLNVGFKLEMDLPGACDSVDLKLVHFSAPAIATGYNASGALVATAAMSGPQNVAETVKLSGIGITRVVIEAPSNETLLLGVCCHENRFASCTGFQTFPVMSLPNPWVYQGIQFFARNFDGSPWPYPGIRNDGAFTGLNAGFKLEMDLPGPCDSVELTLVHFAAPAVATGYNASGKPVATAVMSGPQNVAETLKLSGPGITKVVIEAPSNETLLLGVCCRVNRLVIDFIIKARKTITLVWGATPGHTYRVQFKSKLAASDWTDLSGDVTATGVSAAKVDEAIRLPSQRFYRVVELP